MLTIYKASAGSGKTYTLAFQYIRMLLGVKLESGRYVLNHSKYLNGRAPVARPHSHILAITFTNKATAEMKSRIIKELDAIGQVPPEGCKDADYAADLMKDFCCTRQELADAATRALSRILYDYSAFNISTIDSFFQTILRTFAREIDRQGDFRIELESNYAIQSAVAMLLDTANYDEASISPAVVQWLNKISNEQLLNGADFNPFNRGSRMSEDLTGRLQKIFNETYESHAEEVRKYLEEPARLQGFEARLRELSEDFINREAALAKDVLNAVSSAGMSEDNINKYILAMARNSIANPGLSKDDFDKIVKQPKYIVALQNGNSDGFYTKLPKNFTPPESVGQALCAWFETAEKSVIKRGIYTALIKETNTLRALSFIDEFINRFRTENNLILISDTNSLIGAIINDSDTPFIYERVGTKLQNFLIDEFQDTSQLQWKNLQPLLADSLAYDHDSLIIGDVKQSIYRFRGADSSLLAHQVASEDFPRNHSIKGAAPGENTNYRSAHDIVRFNNTLFHTLAESNGIFGYEGIAQSLAKNTSKLTAHIQIRNLSKDSLGNSLAKWMSNNERQRVFAESEENSIEAALYLTGRTIMEQNARGYNWSDIAILCRNNSSAAEVIEYLMSNFPEIKLMSEEALLLRNSNAVKMIVSMLEIIDKSYAGFDPQESEEDARKMTQRRRRDMMVDRFEYFLGHGDNTEEALNKALNASDATSNETEDSDSISDDLAAIRANNPANLPALVDAIIKRKIIDTTSEDEIAYITAFADVVVDFAENYTPSVHKFLEYWNKNSHKLSISPSDGQNAVTVMTIHKAKGLEWKCVHIPLMKWELQAGAEDGWFSLEQLTEVDSELRPPLMYLKKSGEFSQKYSPILDALNEQIEKATADNLNVAYVAFTRAVRELHVNLTELKAGTMPLAVVDALSQSVPTEDIYMDLRNHTDQLGNFTFGEPTVNEIGTKEATDGNDTRPKRRIKPTLSSETYKYSVEFSEAGKVITQVDDILAQSESDPDIGNNATPSPVDELVEEAARRGRMLHSILELMTSYNDLEKALKFCAGRLPKEEIEEYRQILLRAFEEGGELTKLWFDTQAKRILTEQPIYDSKHNKNTRPDRIVWTREGTVDIIDYKFTTEVRPSHATQIRDYADKLAAMGYSNIRTFLWYPLSPKIIEI